MVEQGFGVVVGLGNIAVVQGGGLVEQGLYFLLRPGQAVRLVVLGKYGAVQPAQRVVEHGETAEKRLAGVNRGNHIVVFLFRKFEILGMQLAEQQLFAFRAVGA